SHQLRDLSGRVKIDIFGGPSLWSDYRGLLRDLNIDVATYRGEATPEAVAQILASSDGLIQLSHYEPFGLAVAEALASGVPVIVSSSVGATEDVDPMCKYVAPAGDVSAAAECVRRLLRDLDQRSGEIRSKAR